MKITDGVVATNIAWRFAERFLAQGISFIVSLVLARILVPDDYAAVSIIAVILTFLTESRREVFAGTGAERPGGSA